MGKDIIEEVNITDYKNFIPIENEYYGGYQKWLFTENMTKKF